MTKFLGGKKPRDGVHKQHVWLQIDFEIRAETIEQGIKRCAQLFRKAFRTKLVEGLVYMGAHSARCRGSLRPRRTMHPTVTMKKGLPIKPGLSLAEFDALHQPKPDKKLAGQVVCKVEESDVASNKVAYDKIKDWAANTITTKGENMVLPVKAKAVKQKSVLKGLFGK